MRCSGITLHLQCQRPRPDPKVRTRNLFIPFAKTQNLPNLTKRLGGARRSRTDDLMLAKHALYQLSYGPQKVMVGPGRLELPTSRLSGVRSNQAELRAYGGTTARQETRARDRTSNHRRPNARRFMEAKEERETETAAPRSLLEFQ